LKLARAAWPVLAGLLIGLAAGAVWTVLQPDRYRAEARVLIRGEARGLVAAVKALAESSLLEQNLAQTLRLEDTPQVTATGGKGGVITLSTEGGSSERARQIDGEAAIVLGRLVTTRFGPRAEATVLDPAHTVEQTSPTPGRNFLQAGLLGLVASALATIALARRGRISVSGGTINPGVERRLQDRIDAVAKLERGLARRAGELAQREVDLRERERRLAARENAVAVATAAESGDEAVVSEREAEPETVVTRPPAAGRWNLHGLEAFVRERGDADREQYDEWMTYLFLLREHADSDGALPSPFDSLINEIFAPPAQYMS
jgi:hypothetical protein